MTNETRSKLSAFIRDPMLDQIELQLQDPNIFYILRLQSTEIRHSNFLAWMLDPRGNHGLQDLLLKRLFRDVFSSGRYEWMDEFGVESLDLSGTQVEREWHGIDLLITTPNFVVCIENKVTASEHTEQLHRYRDEISGNFPDLEHVFVYLTPHGERPGSEEDAAVYVTYSYDEVCTNLETILRLHGNSLSSRVRTYLEDYLTILRREIMQEDPLNELARKIYASHKPALDFIFENKPDHLSEVGNIFEQRVARSNWKLGTTNKGFTRFLTPDLEGLIPRTGTGWKGKEAFLFEIDYWPSTINIKTMIPPGDEAVRSILARTVGSLPGAHKPKGSQFLAHFNKKWRFDVTSQSLSDTDIVTKLDQIWPDVRSLVEKVESGLLSIADELKKYV